jgi:hypothetical protein
MCLLWLRSFDVMEQSISHFSNSSTSAKNADSADTVTDTVTHVDSRRGPGALDITTTNSVVNNDLPL